MINQRWYTVHELASVLKFNPETIRRLIRGGSIRAVKVRSGRKAHWRIREDWVNQPYEGVRDASQATAGSGRAVVLVSGGLDSATTLAIAKNNGFEVYALTFRYGQRHEFEIEAAQRVVSQIGAVEHRILNIDLRLFGGSALTSDLTVPKNRSADEMSAGIPVTYVPARNTIFLSFALAWAEVLAAQDIFIGVNAVDYSGYPDCRPEYIEAYERMANLATKEGVEGRRLTIHTPLIRLSKKSIIEEGLRLGIDYANTNTCYEPSPRGEACGQCDACRIRLKGFAENGIEDPVSYQGERAIMA